MNDLVPASVTGRPAPGGSAAGAALRRAAPALAAYAAIRLLGLVVLAVWSAAGGKDWHTLLTARWDSLWYSRIAEQGYGHAVALPNGDIHSDLAFFPLLPWLERGLSAFSPLSPADAGMAVAWLSSLAAAWALYATGERLHGPRAGVALAALWAALPVGIVQSMAYSESLFTALAAWAGYAVLSGRWVWAGALAALAGLTRPVGAAVVAAVWITAAVTLWRERAGGVPLRAALRARPGMAAGALLAPLGWCGYFLWVAVRQGSPTGYLDVQGGWGNGFDGGLAFAGFLRDQLSGPGFAAGLGLLAGVGLVIWLYVHGVRRGQPLPLAVYGGVVLLLALTAKGYFGSKPRLMLPAYPLLLPPAAALARWRPVWSGLVIGLLAVGSAVYGAFWLNGSGPP
ncbi:hypothetical protein SSP35_02_06830 [Streptomyces sp. NBRC 110611]|uniref:hypothetical protein n=1 Tax=Streptomyces sp. NBRC 110611 TaxID=1621259 RepID=UPI00083505FF|nr:hypothetical protein [Streptomyces sp. NBRC 110611]GAU66310.1 hypothetical protein SSP35_02_06830 [Streptomyces sp. NBRC 110611]